MSLEAFTSILLTPTKLGPFELHHRIVVSPPSYAHMLGVDDFYGKCTTKGGLVIVPFNDEIVSTSTRDRIAKTIHEYNGIAFCLVDASDGPGESLIESLRERITEALSCGYDGIELDVSQGSILKNKLFDDQTQAQGVTKLSEVLKSVVSMVPEQCLGIRFSPFAAVRGHRAPNFPQFHISIIKSITRGHPLFAFMHFVNSTAFEDFEHSNNQSLDVFRDAIVSSKAPDTPMGCGTQFISANGYTSEDALSISSHTGELVSFGLTSLSNPNIVSLIRNGSPLQHCPRVLQRLSDIRAAFREGKEYVFSWGSVQRAHIMNAMKVLGEYLGQFEPALSYEGTDKRVAWRKSCWLASNGIAHPFLCTEDEIARFDGDLKDGLSGLAALQDVDVRNSLECLKQVLDSTLVSCSRAIGLGTEMIQRCTVRYRIIKYVAHAGNPGGIGLHPDGNLLSALITDGHGLGVYDFNGTYREPGFEGSILMGGSTLYRWSKGAYLPTFHDVSIGQEQRKTSIVAFFNFPDLENIPQTVAPVEEDSSFFHDIRRIKEDDKSPTGELASLWKVIIRKHKLLLPPHVPARA